MPGASPAPKHGGEVLDFGVRTGLYTTFVYSIPSTYPVAAMRRLLASFGVLEKVARLEKHCDAEHYALACTYLSRESASVAASGLSGLKPWLRDAEGTGVHADTAALRAHKGKGPHVDDESYEGRYKAPSLLRLPVARELLNAYVGPFSWSNTIDVVEVNEACAKRARKAAAASVHRRGDRPPYHGELEAIRKQVLDAAGVYTAASKEVAASSPVPGGGDGAEAAALAAAHRLAAPPAPDDDGVDLPPEVHAMLRAQAAGALPGHGHASALPSRDSVSDTELSLTIASRRFDGYGLTLLDELGLSASRGGGPVQGGGGGGSSGGVRRPDDDTGDADMNGVLLDDVVDSVWAEDGEQDEAVAALQREEEAEVEAERALDDKAVLADPSLLARQQAQVGGIRRSLKVGDVDTLAKLHRLRPVGGAKVPTARFIAGSTADFPTTTSMVKGTAFGVKPKQQGSSGTGSGSAPGQLVPLGVLPSGASVHAPCVFVRELLHIHNADGTTVTSVASGGCACRHRKDGVETNVAFRTMPASAWEAAQGRGTPGSRGAAVRPALLRPPSTCGTAVGMLASAPPSEMASAPLLAMSQQASQSPPDLTDGGVWGDEEGGVAWEMRLSQVLDPPSRASKRKRSMLQKKEWSAEDVLAGRPVTTVLGESFRFAANGLQLWVPKKDALHGFIGRPREAERPAGALPASGDDTEDGGMDA